MGPKRPPPLPKTLFEANGPLAPGSAPLPPSPTKVHPAFVIDAHSFDSAGDLYEGLADNLPRPQTKERVKVVLDTTSETTSTPGFSTHPTILDLSTSGTPSISNTSKAVMDLIVPSTYPLTTKEWDQLDEAVSVLDDSAAIEGLGERIKQVAMTEEEKAAKKTAGKIVISGLLPPPLTLDSDALGKDPSYDLYIGRLNQLSLHPSVYLKVLPPVVQSGDGSKWFTDRKELERVLRMYLSPAIESFGTHRIMYGSCPALPLSSQEEVDLPITEKEWYAVLRKAVTELGEGEEAVNGVFGGVAEVVYGSP